MKRHFGEIIAFLLCNPTNAVTGPGAENDALCAVVDTMGYNTINATVNFSSNTADDEEEVVTVGVDVYHGDEPSTLTEYDPDPTMRVEELKDRPTVIGDDITLGVGECGVVFVNAAALKRYVRVIPRVTKYSGSGATLYFGGALCDLNGIAGETMEIVPRIPIPPTI